MKRWWLQSALFLIAFTLEVKVRAQPIQWPVKCAHSQRPCAMLAKIPIEKIELSQTQVFFNQGSSLIVKADNDLAMVRGLARVQVEQEVTVENLFGELKILSGSVLVEATDSDFKFTNLSADLKYKPKGEKEYHDLPVGYSTFFTYVNNTGVAVTGFPHPAEIEALIKKWGSLVYKNQNKEFKKELNVFMISWREASKTVGDWYVQTVQREIASLRAEEDRQARLKAVREAEESKYKNMFRNRIFNQW